MSLPLRLVAGDVSKVSFARLQSYLQHFFLCLPGSNAMTEGNFGRERSLMPECARSLTVP